MPEYETIFALGSMLDNTHKGSIVKANELCDQFGMDTISLGVTLAFAFECYEKGLLPGSCRSCPHLWRLSHHARADCSHGVPPWSGRPVAEGSVRLAAQLGPEASKYLYAV